MSVRPSEMPKLMAIGHTEHSPGLLGPAFHEEGPPVYANPNVSSLWSCLGTAAYKPYEDEGELGKTRYLKNFLEDIFLTRWYNSFSKEKKIWVKSYTWFCWQSFMSKAEQNGQNSLPIGTDYGALFIPEHPKSSQLGLWFSTVLSLEQFIAKWEYCSY